MDKPDAQTITRIERLLGGRVVASHRAVGGYSSAGRFIVTLSDGRTAFVKTGRDVEWSKLATWLRIEARLYQSMTAEFLPEFLGFDDDIDSGGDAPILAIEDLSHAHWPPPWGDSQIKRVLEALNVLRSTLAPSWVPPLEDLRGELEGWPMVARDPQPFLALHLASRGWLERSLPTLLAAEAAVDLSGDALVHADIRSDNLCLHEGRVRLIDWNWVHRGSLRFDLASWLPSLHHEGGPPPIKFMPESGGLSSLISGFFAARAGLPPIPNAPRIRWIQNAQLRAALPWVCSELGLHPPDGSLSD